MAKLVMAARVADTRTRRPLLQVRFGNILTPVEGTAHQGVRAMANPVGKLLRRLLGDSTPARLLEVGSAAPDFRVGAHDGSTVSLSGLRGRKVVLWFYPKADTPGCTVEGKGFCSSHTEFERRGATILGVSFDDRAANAAFATKFGFPYPLLCDTDRRLGMAYGACDSPDAKHARRITYVIDEHGTIRHVLPKVDPATHTAEVLALVS